MNKLVGVSLMSLMFLSAHAKPEISGSSWSLRMSQNNEEPIQVQSERKEYDDTGVTLHRRTKGIIEDGVYKTIDEEDLRDFSQRRSRDIDSLLKIANQYENEKKDFRENKRKMKPRSDGFFRLKYKEGWPFKKYHPRRYGHRLGEDSQETERFSGKHHHKGKCHKDPTESMKDRLQSRSRVSFYRPVERMFEKIFGTKKHETGDRKSFRENPRMQKPIRPYKKIDREEFSKRDNWFEDFERQNQEATAELLRSMQEFENNFFDEHYGTEE